MTEAVKKFMTHIIKEFKLRRIASYAYEQNKGSMKVMEKAGMKFEGIAKKYALKDGKFLDCHVYAKVR